MRLVNVCGSLLGYEPEKQALPSFRRLSNGRNALNCKSLERDLLLVHLILSAVPASFVVGTTDLRKRLIRADCGPLTIQD